MADSLTIGVTGAAGYIGSRVAAELTTAGHDVVPVDDFSGGDVREVGRTRIEDVDITDRAEITDAFSGVDGILHLAAVSGVPGCRENPTAAFDVNVGGTENVTWFCRQHDVPLVFAGSVAALGDPREFPISASHPRDPDTLYGLTKKMSEDDVHDLADAQFPAFVYLITNLYGTHRVNDRTVGKETVLNIFVERALSGDPLQVHEPGTQTLNYVHVADVARAFVDGIETLVGADDGARTVPVGSDEEFTVLELAELVQRVVATERGIDVAVEVVDNPREVVVAPDRFPVDTDAACEAFGFEAERTVEETVRREVSR